MITSGSAYETHYIGRVFCTACGKERRHLPEHTQWPACCGLAMTKGCAPALTPKPLPSHSSSTYTTHPV